MKYFALVTRGSSPGSGIAVGKEKNVVTLKSLLHNAIEQSAASLIVTD